MQERRFQVTTDTQREWLARFVAKQPVPFQAVVGPLREPRSLTQNARYWKILQLASEVSGYSPDELHEEMLCAHYGYTEQERTNPWTGEIEVKRIPNKRSSARDKKEFARLMEFAENLLGEKLGVWLPSMQ